MEKKEGLRSAGCGKVISISDDDGGGDDDGENDVEDGNDGNQQRFVVKMKLLGNQAALQLVSEATRHQVTKKTKRTLINDTLLRRRRRRRSGVSWSSWWQECLQPKSHRSDEADCQIKGTNQLLTKENSRLFYC